MAGGHPEQRRRLVCATILYWQARENKLLEPCLTSLLAQECGPAVELKILLIDNGCGIAADVPFDERVERISLSSNRGFAGGHNVGLRRALELGAEFVFLFNSDAVAEASCLAELLAVADAEPSAAFVGALLLRSTSYDRVESAGQTFSTAMARHTEISRDRSASSVGMSPRRVDAVSGCALLARTAAVGVIGWLDERLFAYFEDLDWCVRARQAGYSVHVAPRARVHHLGNGSTSQASPLSTYYSVRNHMRVAKQYGGRVPEALALAYQLAYLVRSPERRTRQHFVALARGASDALAGRLGAQPCSSWP